MSRVSSIFVVVFLSVCGEARAAKSKEPVQLAVCIAAIMGEQPQSEIDSGVLSLARNIDRISGNPRELWNFSHESEPPSEKLLALYAREYQESLARYRSIASQPDEFLLLALVAETRATEIVANEITREYRRLLRTQGNSETIERLRLQAIHLYKKCLFSINGIARKDKFPPKFRAFFVQIVSECSRAVLTLEGLRIKTDRVQIASGREAGALAIPPQEGDHPLADLSRKIGNEDSKYKLVFVPQLCFEERPPDIGRDTSILFLKLKDIIYGPDPQTAVAVRRSERNYASLAKSDSGLEVSYLSPGQQIEGVLGINRCQALADGRHLIPELITEFSAQVPLLTEVTLEANATLADVLGNSERMVGILDRILADLDDDSSPVYSRRQGGVYRAYRLMGRNFVWQMGYSENLVGAGANLFQVGTGNHRILVPVKTKRQRMLLEKLLEKVPESRANPRKTVPPPTAREERELLWELVSSAKRFNEITRAVNLFANARLTEIMETLALFAEEKSQESFTFLREQIALLEMPKLTNVTIRNLPREVNPHLFTPSEDFEPASIEPSWLGPIPGFAHHVANLKEAGKEERKRVIERIAMTAIERYSAKAGWQWRDVSADNFGYDILLERTSDKAALHVEVKARSEGERSVLLSRNEIQSAPDRPKTSVLAIVTVDSQGNSQISLLRDFAGNALSAPELGRSYSIPVLMQKATGVSLGLAMPSSR